MHSIFHIEKNMPRLRSQAENTKTAAAVPKNEREVRASSRDSRKPRKNNIAHTNKERRPAPDSTAEAKSSKTRKATEERRSLPSTQRPQQRSGGKWRPEYHETLEGNSLSPTSRVQSSSSSPTSNEPRQRKTSNDTSPSSAPERTPMTPPLESDRRRRDIDGEIIESPDSDGHEYLGENPTKKYSLLGQQQDNHRPQKKRKKNVEQEVVHVEKVWTNPPPAGWKA